ncbi:MAG: winged helix-turn-helix transcriptional regulator [Spirochaetia bacterium]|nr:winged helix-turn-helix transcriptional regulator [Spirochaetia bacterium]
MDLDLATLQVISETLKEAPQASQRTLAKKANMSLGMMNAILGRFVERGWIMLTNVNGRKLAYAVTPDGLTELANRGKKFALRTFKLANVYSEAFCRRFMEAKAAGKTKVVLYGDSYIKFIIKYACSEVGLDFEQKDTSATILIDEVCLAGELNDDDVQKKLIEKGCFNLVEIIQDCK